MNFIVDFSQWSNIIFFLLYLAVASVLTVKKMFPLAAIMFLIAAFVLYSSGVSIIFALVPLFAGLFVAYGWLK